MRYPKLILILFLNLCVSIYSQSRILQFSDPDINKRNEIILKVTNPSPSGKTYTVLVRGEADGKNPEALTVFPEESSFSARRNELVIYNHFGCYSYDSVNRIWTENRFFSTFSDNHPVSPLSLIPLEMSPDGRYALFVHEGEETSSLILFDRDRNIRVSITDRLRREYVHKMAKWSPDSKYFIYRRGRELYYFSIDQYLTGRIPAESFRNTGFRDIQSIQWEQGNYLYVLKNRIVYRIHSSEFFTRSFYSDPFRKGVVWGKIPVSYDPAFDKFNIDRKGKMIFFQKNGQGGMIFHLQRNLSSDTADLQTPMLNSSEYVRIEKAEWLYNGSLLVLLKDLNTDEEKVIIYSEGGDSGFRQLQTIPLSGFSVSPDGTGFALFSRESVTLYAADSLAPIGSYPLKNTMDFYWGDGQYIATGSSRITTIDSLSGKTAIAGLSQIETAGFTPGGGLIGSSDGEWFEYREALTWKPAERSEVRPSRSGTDEFRIYLEPLRGQWYDSTLKIRDVDGVETRDFIPLFRPPAPTDMPAILTADSRTNPWYFDHGSRDENKEVCLVFNGIDTAEGVDEVIKILADYQINGTFFLNGDFIHANPAETSMIASSGNTVGSLFYTWFDMSDPGYQIDKTFLKKGLARNEDDYFIATGKEMTMLWHAPDYYINAEILETSQSMEYIYVGTDINVSDRIRSSGWKPGKSGDSVQLSSELLAKVRPGSIIPMTLGKNEGQEEYLFQLLPVIIEDLLRKDYSIVPLTEMIKSSR